MLVALASVKGSPGTTTFALALAARWPRPGAAPALVELDPAGGDVGSRWQRHDEPGLAGLVLAARHDLVGDGAAFVQRLPVGADVILAPPGDAAAATMAEFAAVGPAVLRALAATRPVLADLGRLDTRSPALPYLEAADELVLVVRPRPEELRHLRTRLPGLLHRCGRARLVLAGAGPYRPDEIVEYLQLPVAGVAPHDPVAADILAGRSHPVNRGGLAGRLRRGEGWWTRRPLLAAARTLAGQYATHRAAGRDTDAFPRRGPDSTRPVEVAP